jgi:hypothetical protein
MCFLITGNEVYAYNFGIRNGTFRELDNEVSERRYKHQSVIVIQITVIQYPDKKSITTIHKGKKSIALT